MHTHASTRAHTCMRALTIITVTAATAKWIEVIFWLWVALRIRGQGHCLTPCQNLSCQSQRRNFWLALYQVHLEMIKQGAKNDNYTSLISLVRHWYLDGMGIKIELFSYNKKANLRDLLAAIGLVFILKLDSNHRFFNPCDLKIWWVTSNKANLRDLIAATGLVILLKLDSNHRFFSRETPNLGQNRRFF